MHQLLAGDQKSHRQLVRIPVAIHMYCFEVPSAVPLGAAMNFCCQVNGWTCLSEHVWRCAAEVLLAGLLAVTSQQQLVGLAVVLSGVGPVACPVGDTVECAAPVVAALVGNGPAVGATAGKLPPLVVVVPIARPLLSAAAAFGWCCRRHLLRRFVCWIHSSERRCC